MKPVNQTKFGPVYGNCFAACIASLLELPIEEVDDAINPHADTWLADVQAFLKPRNMFFLEVRIDVAKAYPLYEMNGIYAIFTGKSPRTFEGHDSVNHCVVGRIDSEPGNPVLFNAVHDPHPDKTFLKPDSVFALGFLIKLDPSKS